MKRFLILLSILCFGAYADTIAINWGVDNQPYTTTTCEIGGDVILPPVSKRGYIFRGWTPEHFDRGTFENYESVPSDISSYYNDVYNNRIPRFGDFITVKNASGYCLYDIHLRGYYVSANQSPYLDVIYRGSAQTLNLNNCKNGCSVAGDLLSVESPEVWTVSVYAKSDGVYYNKNFYNTGDKIFTAFYSNINNHVYFDCEHLNAWRFKYHGTWATDGKNGWKPAEQITSNSND